MKLCLNYNVKPCEARGIEAYYKPVKYPNADPAGLVRLPGLIVKLFDTQKKILIEADIIESGTPSMIYYPDELPIITHLEFFERFRKS